MKRRFDRHAENALPSMRSSIIKKLNSISPDCPHNEWFQILAASKTELGESGKEVVREWSSQSTKYSEQSFEATWKSALPGHFTAGTIFHAAQSGPSHNVISFDTTRTKLNYAKRLWKNAIKDDVVVFQHPYSQRKLKHHNIVSAFGAGRGTASGKVIGQNADCVINPLRTLDHEFTGVECIDMDGKKQSFGRKGLMMLGNTRNTEIPIFVVEGWATAVSTWIMEGDVVVVATFGKPQLTATADELGRRYPNRRVIDVQEA